MAGINPQLSNIAIMLFMFQLSKKIQFDDPTVLLSVRSVYVVSNVLILGIYMFVQLKINKKNDLTTLKYVEPAPMGTQEEPKLVTTTIKSYDISQVKTALKAQAIGIAMMGFMHLYMKYTNPLLIQSILPLKGALENNMVKIHLYGQAASGDLKRPFKAGGQGGLLGALGGAGQGEIKTDKASIEAAERAGTGGAKEE